MENNSLVGQASAIDSYEDLVLFLKAFERNLSEHPDQWENDTLPRFLESFAAWAEDWGNCLASQGQPTPQPSWRFFAEMLLAAKAYE